MNEWKIIIDKEPPMNKVVLVWRRRNKKFTVASLFRYCPPKGEEAPPYKSLQWVTQHGVAFDVSPEDRWVEFPNLTIIEEKKYG